MNYFRKKCYTAQNVKMADFFQDGCQMVPDLQVWLDSIVKLVIEVCNLANTFLWGCFFRKKSAGHDKNSKWRIFSKMAASWSPILRFCRNHSENDDGSLKSGQYVPMMVLFQKNVLVMINIQNGECIQDGRQMGSYLQVLLKSIDKMVVEV